MSDWSFQKATDGSYTDEHYTPPALVEALERDLKIIFTLDPCATPESAKAPKYYTIHDNGLAQDWSGEVVFCNPPYSDLKEWIIKCANSGALAICSWSGAASNSGTLFTPLRSPLSSSSGGTEKPGPPLPALGIRNGILSRASNFFPELN